MNIPFSNKNTKCGKQTLILNMTTALDCPSNKLGLCVFHKICYARQAELQYVHRVPQYRKRQSEAWKKLDTKEVTKQIVLNAIHRYAKIKWLRVSECGDFRNQEDVNKLSEIARRLDKYGIRVYTYTKRRDLYFDKINDNLVVNGSEFMLDNEFRAVDEYSGKYVQCMENCSICDLCKNKSHIIIENKFHGVHFNYLKRKEKYGKTTH